MQHLAGTGHPQIEGDAALVPIERLEVEAVLLAGERRDVPPDVTAGRRVLDLDDLGAEVGKLHGGERPGPELAERDDAPGRERQIHTVILVGRWEERERGYDSLFRYTR